MPSPSLRPPSDHRGGDDAAAIGDDALAPLRALLRAEAHPLHQAGRAYLADLTGWRDRLAARKADDAFLSAEAAAVLAVDAAAAVGAGAVVDGPVGGAMTTPMRGGDAELPVLSWGGDNDDTASAQSRADSGRRTLRRTITPDEGGVRSTGAAGARPDEQPELLLQWRAKTVEAFFGLTERLGYELNTSIVALSYLDAYSMSVCFPKQFRRMRRGGSREEDTSSEPSPSKKRKTDGQQVESDDGFWQAEVDGISPDHYQLAAISSFYIASKVYQSTPSVMTPAFLAQYMRNTISPRQIEGMETILLGVLGYMVHPPTSLRFVQELMPLLLSRRTFTDDVRYALDARPWAPEDATQEKIFSDASYLATFASFTDAADFPPIVSAPPSKIALAAIVEVADGLFHKEKRLVKQREFRSRLAALVDVSYDQEVREIHRCLVELQRLNSRKKDGPRMASRGESPATVSELPPEAAEPSTAAPPHASNDKEHLCISSSTKLNEQRTDSTASSCTAAIHQAVKHQPSSKRTRKCPGGRNHRCWERADECASAATKASRLHRHFAAEEGQVSHGFPFSY